jgi:hypothetical protein
LHHRSRKRRANARPLPETETIAGADEVAVSLIDSFPASDPPTWIPLARVGIPKRKPSSLPARKP